jgi:hypothetical protein
MVSDNSFTGVLERFDQSIRARDAHDPGTLTGFSGKIMRKGKNTGGKISSIRSDLAFG